MRLRTLTAAAVSGLVSTLLLTGCGTQSRSSTHSASPVPSAPTPTTPTGGASPATGAPRTLADRLLHAGDLPGGDWRGTRPRTVAVQVGACNRFGLDAIGADRVVHAIFTAGSRRVISEVATLPDETTGARIEQSLKGLKARCPSSTTAIAELPVDAGAAWSYITGTGDGAEGFGMALNGRLISVVSVTGTKSSVSALAPRLVASAAKRLL